MVKISDIGIELLKSNKINFQTVDLQVLTPQIYGESVLEYVIKRIYTRQSLFFVGDNVSYPFGYVVSVARLFKDKEYLTELVQEFSRKLVDKVDKLTLEGRTNQMIKSLSAYSMFYIDIQRITSMSANFNEIVERLKENGDKYIYVFDHLDLLYSKEQKNQFLELGQRIFSLTRMSRKIVFLAPLNWNDYATNIENGHFQRLIEHRKPVLFTLRPSDLPETPITELSPERYHSFD